MARARPEKPRPLHARASHGPPLCPCLGRHSGPWASTGTARQNGLAHYRHDIRGWQPFDLGFGMIRAVGYDHCIALYISRSASATTPNPKSFPPCSRSRFAQCLSRSRSLLSSLPPAPTTMAKGDDASNGGGRQRLAAGPTSSSRPPDAQELRRTMLET